MSQDVLTSCQYIVIYFFNIEAQNVQFTHSVQGYLEKDDTHIIVKLAPKGQYLQY